MNRNRIQILIAASLIVGLAAVAQTANAAAGAHKGLKISLTLDGSSADPNVKQLTNTMQAAAKQWEAIFADLPSPGPDISIKYWWRKGTEGSSAAGTRDEYVPAKTTDGTLGSTTHSIKFYTQWLQSDGTVSDIPWYIDTDLNDPAAEFDLQQMLFRDSDWSLGLGLAEPAGLPELMEVSYHGDALPGGGAEDKVDLYTYALRQIGQTLLDCGSEPIGVGSVTARTLYLDSFTSTFVSGSSSARCMSDHIHVDSLMKDMRNSLDDVAFGKRYLPSTLDIFLIAASRGWTQVRLPHREMLLPRSYASSEVQWVDPNVWLGGLVPDSSSDAYVRDMNIDEVTLGGAANARDLYVGWDPNPLTTDRHAFRTDRDSLTLSGDLTVESDETAFYVDGGWATVAGDAFVEGGASLSIGGRAYIDGTLSVLTGLVYMMGGAVVADLIDNDPEGEITGNGSVRGILINDGLIDPDQVGPLLFFGVSLDLDGARIDEDGRIEAIDNSIYFTGPIADPFGGGMVIEERVVLSEEWTIDGSGEVTFEADSPYLVARNTVVDNGVLIAYAVEGHLASPVTFRTGSVVYAQGSLDLDGDTTFQGGLFHGAGVVNQIGDVLVAAGADVLIAVDTYNWDGENCLAGPPAGHTTEIEAGAYFHIIQDITSCTGDGYDGSVTIHGVLGGEGVLEIDHAWQLDGVMLLDGGIVFGGDMTNHGSVSGTGTIYSTFHSSDGSVDDPEGDIVFVNVVP